MRLIVSIISFTFLYANFCISQSSFRTFYNAKKQIYDDVNINDGFYKPLGVFELDGAYVAWGNRNDSIEISTPNYSSDTSAPYLICVDKLSGAIINNEKIKNESCNFRIIDYEKGNFGFIGVGVSWSPGDSCKVVHANDPPPPVPTSRMFLIRFDVSGKIIWQKNFSEPNFDFVGTEIEKYQDSLFVLRAFKKNKISGEVEWNYVLLNQDGDLLTSIPILSSNGITSKFKKNSKGYLGLFATSGVVVQYDDDFNFVSSFDFAESIDLPEFFLVDETFMLLKNISTEPGVNKVRLSKYNKSFELEWQHTYEGIYAGNSFAEVSDGNYVIGYTDFAKVSPDGEILWSHNYFGDDIFGYISGIMETSDGGFLISARTGKFNLMLIKTDCKGNLEWSNSSCKRPSENNFDLYPNPVSDIAHLQLSNIEDGQEVSVNVSNLAGQIVKRYVSTNTLLNLDLSELSTGVYYYSIYVDGVFYDSSKLVKI